MHEHRLLLSQLRSLILKHLDKPETTTLCFELGIPYDHLRGDNLPAKVVDLLIQASRQELLPDLLLRLQQTRPSVDWPEIPPDFESPFLAEENDSFLASFQKPGVQIQGDVNLHGGAFVGRDQINYQLNTFVERGQTAVEQAQAAREADQAMLAEGVLQLLETLRRQFVTDPPYSSTPFRALSAYELGDVSQFRGREQAIAAFLRKIHTSRITILHAPSGAGKTSLLQAGIAPRLLSDGHLPVHVRFKPQLIPYIKQQFLPGIDETERLATASLHSFLHKVSRILGDDATIYLFLDQFEEFFTHPALTPIRHREILTELGDCMDAIGLPVRWVVSLRTEFANELSTLDPRFKGQYELPSLTRDEARQIILGPAQQHDIKIEEKLLNQLLDDLVKESAAPADLQIVCNTLYEHDAASFELAVYEQWGGVRGILQRYRQSLLKKGLPRQYRQPAEVIVKALVDSRGHRALRSASELLFALERQGFAAIDGETLLTKLRQQRILRMEDAGVDPTYELIHDYLLPYIELDKGERERKQIAELLARSVDAKLPVGEAVLDRVTQHQDEILLDEQRLALLLRSAVANGRTGRRWVERLSPTGRTQLIASLAEERAAANPAQRRRAEAALWALRDHLPPNLYWPVWWSHQVNEVRRLKTPVITILILVGMVGLGAFVSKPARVTWRATPLRWQGQTIIPRLLATDETQPDTLLVGDGRDRFWLSEDGGLSWESIPIQLPAPAALADLAVTEEQLYLLTNAGLWQKDHANAGWTLLASLSGGKALAMPPAHTALFIGGESGVMRWENGAVTILDTPPEMEATTVTALASNGNWLLAATTSGLWVTSQLEPLSPNWIFVSPTISGCHGNGRPQIRSLTAIGAASNDFLAVLDNGTVCLGELFAATKTGVVYETLPADAVIKLVGSEHDLYAIGDEMLWCQRQWTVDQFNWWKEKWTNAIPCRGW